MKKYTNRYLNRQNQNQLQFQLDKTQSKFNRKPIQNKQAKKKYKDAIKEDQRICFMSPERINMLLTNNQHSFRSGRSPSIPNYFQSPTFLPQDQSLIHNTDNQTHQNCKMNDSLLSMYNQLNLQKEEEIISLKNEVSRLTQIIEQLRAQQSSWLQKEMQMQGLREYLMKRQTYICEIHEQNVELNQKNVRLQKEKDMIFKQAEYFRKIFDKEREQNQIELKALQAQLNTLKQQNQRINQQNQQIKQQMKEFQELRTRKLLMKSQSLKELSINGEDDQLHDSATNEQKNSNAIKDNNMACSLKLNINKEANSKKPYHALLSSRSSMVQPRDFEDDEDIYKKSKVSSKKCGCRVIIESLYQKIRYNQIQIDILKRVKAKEEVLRTENDRLRKHNSTLLNRIEYLCERRKKQPRRRKDSDSSLQLSLSPSHKHHRL